MKVLIAGKSGQLAREFARQLAPPAFRVEAPEENELDITHFETVRAIIGASRPDVVLNCAAYNFVDAAEQSPETAFAVNATGAGNLAAACREAGAFLIHYSTDYVFDGLKGAPYTEEDAPGPVCAYGQSKLAGERLVAGGMDAYLLLRVSWVFGDGKQNFFYKMLEAARTHDVLRVVDDQVSVPTSTRDIVRFTMLALDKGLRGLYHLTNSGFASRYETVRYYFSKLGVSSRLIPVGTDYFPSPARRPRFSALSNAKLAAALDVEIPHWTDGVDWYAERAFTGPTA